MAQRNKTPTISFRWDRADELDEQIPEYMDRSTAMREILNEWIDDPDSSFG
jgi:hypothetical protein